MLVSSREHPSILSTAIVHSMLKFTKDMSIQILVFIPLKKKDQTVNHLVEKANMKPPAQATLATIASCNRFIQDIPHSLKITIVFFEGGRHAVVHGVHGVLDQLLHVITLQLLFHHQGPFIVHLSSRWVILDIVTERGPTNVHSSQL